MTPTQGYTRHLGVPVLEVLKTHGQKVVPVSEEKCLLGDTQETRDQGEDGQPVFVLGGHVQCGGIQHLHKVLETRYIHLIFHSLYNKTRMRRRKKAYRRKKIKCKEGNTIVMGKQKKILYILRNYNPKKFTLKEEVQEKFRIHKKPRKSVVVVFFLSLHDNIPTHIWTCF